MSEHPLSQLVNEFGDIKIINNNVFIVNGFKETFCESLRFFEERFIAKNNIVTSNEKSFSEVISDFIQNFCYNQDSKRQSTLLSSSLKTNIKPDGTYLVNKQRIFDINAYEQISYFPQKAKKENIPLGTHGTIKKVHLSSTVPYIIDIKTTIPEFGVRLDSGIYYFDEVDLSMRIIREANNCKLADKPRVVQKNYEHFFVYSHGEICYGDSKRWTPYTDAFIFKPFTQKKLGFTYAQVLNESIRTLHLGYKHDKIQPVKKPSELSHLQRKNSFFALVYDNR